VKEIERLLEGEAKRNAKFQKQVNRRKHNMDDINARQADLRKNLVSGTLTGAERQELLDAYESLEKAYELAEKVNARLAEKLTAAGVEIRGLEKRLGEVTEALRRQKKKGAGLQMLLDELQDRLEKTEAEREGYKRELETTTENRDRYKRAFDALKETDSSTPTGSEVSSKTPEDGPAQGPAGCSTGPGSQPHAAQTEQGNRDGSPHGTIKTSEIGASMTKTSTGSSGRHSHHRRSWEVVAESVRTHEYGSAVVPGGKVVKRETSTLLKPEKARDKKSSSGRSQKKTRRASKNSL
jgi:predicted  nucleic acid-binding Zn-ribbon protein